MKLKILFLSCIAMQSVAMDPVARAKITELARQMAAIIDSTKIRHNVEVGSNRSLPTFRDVGVGPTFHPIRRDTKRKLINLVCMNAGISDQQAEFLSAMNPDNIFLRGEVLALDEDLLMALVVLQYVEPKTKKIENVRAWVEHEELVLAKGNDFGTLPRPKLSKEFPVGSDPRMRI